MKTGKQSGFTLLEVVISLGIILTLSIALTTLLRSNLDIRASLAERAEVVHRLSLAMQVLNDDIMHAYLISDRPEIQGEVGKRKMNSLFKLELLGAGDELWMTTFNHRSVRANSQESDMTLVVYKLAESKDTRGQTNLYRGAFKRVPETFQEEPKMRLLAKSIKTLKIRAWRGDEWSKDRWDTSKREWRNKLPHMVRIDLDAWEEAPDPLDKTKFDDRAPVMSLKTVVYLPLSVSMAELKERATSVRWEKFGEAVN